MSAEGEEAWQTVRKAALETREAWKVVKVAQTAVWETTEAARVAMLAWERAREVWVAKEAREEASLVAARVVWAAKEE